MLFIQNYKRNIMLFHTYQYIFASQGILVDSAPHTCIMSSAKSLWGAVWSEKPLAGKDVFHDRVFKFC